MSALDELVRMCAARLDYEQTIPFTSEDAKRELAALRNQLHKAKMEIANRYELRDEIATLRAEVEDLKEKLEAAESTLSEL